MSKGPSCPEGPKKCLRRSEMGEGCFIGQYAFNLLCFHSRELPELDATLVCSHLFFKCFCSSLYLPIYWTGFKSAASLVMNWKLPFHRPAAQSIKNLFEYCFNCLHQCALLLVLEGDKLFGYLSFVIQLFSHFKTEESQPAQ